MRNHNASKASAHAAANARVQLHSLRFASQLALEGGGLHLVHGHARATQVRVPAGWAALCLPLGGSVQLQASEGEWTLAAGQLQVWREGELRLGNRGAESWLLLAGPVQAFNALLRALAMRDGQPELFPAQHRCPRGLRRLLVRLARTLRRPELGDPSMLLEALLLETLACQRADLGRYLDRCSGRTPLRRQQTLMRLMRVRLLVEIGQDLRPDMARLARSASYSPWHLIRMYRDVFGETPSEHAQRLRMQRAWRLVRETRLPICEITEALGFESQSSFCRAFRHAYGVTTSDVRRLHRAVRSYDTATAAPRAYAA